MSGKSIEAMRFLFQEEEGGASPTLPLQLSSFRVNLSRWAQIKTIFEQFHYRGGQMGGSIKYCFEVKADNQVIGGAVFGNPWHAETYSDGGTHKCIELRRLCLIDDAPKNSESWFIGYCLRWLKRHTDITRILSYSDTGMGHYGTIYKASGFYMAGTTSGGKKIVWRGRPYHIRSLSIDRPYAKELKTALETGEAALVQTGEKYLWIKDIGQPRPNAMHGYFKELVEDTKQVRLFE